MVLGQPVLDCFRRFRRSPERISRHTSDRAAARLRHSRHRYCRGHGDPGGGLGAAALALIIRGPNGALVCGVTFPIELI